jgi:hypothetical protein
MEKVIAHIVMAEEMDGEENITTTITIIMINATMIMIIVTMNIMITNTVIITNIVMNLMTAAKKEKSQKRREYLSALR